MCRLFYSTRGQGTLTIQQVTPEFQSMVQNLPLTLDPMGLNIVLLTKANSNKIEGAIANDPRYQTGIAGRFYNLCKQRNIDIKNNQDDSLYILLSAIDVDNSTGLKRFQGQGADPIRRVCDYMVSTPSFFQDLLANEPIGIDLPDKICSLITDRDVKSFASKACKYLHQFLLGLGRAEDKYSINDSVVRRVLPYYLDYYGVPHSFTTVNQIHKLSYQDLYKVLSDLQVAAKKKEGVGLTKHEIDHILWYCYKSFSA